MNVSKNEIKRAVGAVVINGTRVVITVKSHLTRFGEVFTAENDYGEPKMAVRGYETRDEAWKNEIRELQALLS